MIRVVIYTDSQELDVTAWTKTINLTRSIMEPYESARLDLAVPFGLDVFPTIEETGALDLDSWVIIYNQEGDDRERAVFLGCLASVTSGFYADTGGELEGGIRARRS